MKTISEKWNLDRIYEGGSLSAELKAEMVKLREDIEILTEKVQTLDVTKNQRCIPDLLNIFELLQDVMSSAFQIDEFLICAVSANVKDTYANKLLDESAKIKSSIETLKVDFEQLLVNIPVQVWNELITLPEVRPYRFYLEELIQSVQDKLPLEMEKLIHCLAVNGFQGWEEQHSLMMNSIRIPVEQDGKVEELSFAQVGVQIMSTNDRAKRKEVVHSMNKVCAKNAESFAAVLNRITGFRLDVYKHRGWDNVLKELLDQNRIKEQSLRTMVETIKEKQWIISKFLKRKAELMKLEKLDWFDIPLPTFASDKKLTYSEAADIVIRQFHSFSEKLGAFAERAFLEEWIDAENRSDKSHGGFCASMPLAKESRIFLTFGGNYQEVVTLAHELGHAYHNFILDKEPAFSRVKGTSVAETASTFTENLVLDAAIDNAANAEEKLALLEMKIVGGLIYLGMIPSMFEFEQKLYDKRKQGLLSASEITALMNDIEVNLYGDIVEEFDTYRWMTQSHFYDSEKAFYNIPYTIGYMFSNGIYALAKREGRKFQEQYDELLRNSGRMTVEELAEVYLNQNLGDKAFWEASIAPIADAVNEYCSITEKML